MAAKQVRVRRDTLSNLNAVVPAGGEIAGNTTDNRIHFGDGTTSGGIPHANFKDVQKSYFDYAADSGSANAVVVALPYSPGSYTAGLRIKFKANATNTTATTINVNGLGTKNIQKYTAGALGALAAGDIVSGGIYEAIYDGTQFQLLTYQKGGITSVSQGNLNTSTGTVSHGESSTGGSQVDLTLPGGEYGFYPQTRLTVSSGGIVGSAKVSILGPETFTNPGTSYQTFISMHVKGATGTTTATALQRYITSSPPFDLGDGEAAGFFFALVDSDGEIKSHYLADVPPWAYNGPTNICATRVSPCGKKKFKQAIRKRTFEEIMDGAKIVFDEVEITHEMKNADMALIPHPFSGFGPGLTPVLLDPMDERIRAMIELQNAGESQEVLNALSGGFIKVDNKKLSKRKGPTGCEIYAMKYKYSGK